MNVVLESIYRQIFDSAVVAIGVTDPSGKFTLVNRTWCNELGYSLSESNNITIQDITPPEDLEKSDVNYHLLLQGKLSNFQIVRRYMRKDKTVFWANLYVSPLLKANKEIEGVLGIFIDIDKQIRTEQHLKDTNEVLEALNSELMKANHEITLKNEQLKVAHKKVDELSRTDKLTGLANRRELENLLAAEIRRTTRSHRGFTVGIADIDDFKKVNDTYGHDMGDKVLIEVSALFKNQMRNTDTVGRWGGEEFLIILPETDCNHALVVMNRICVAASEHILQADHKHLHITLSIGFSSFVPGSSRDIALKEADIALYACKHQGKNMAICYSEEMQDNTAHHGIV